MSNNMNNYSTAVVDPEIVKKRGMRGALTN